MPLFNWLAWISHATTQTFSAHRLGNQPGVQQRRVTVNIGYPVHGTPEHTFDNALRGRGYFVYISPEAQDFLWRVERGGMRIAFADIEDRWWRPVPLLLDLAAIEAREQEMLEPDITDPEEWKRLATRLGIHMNGYWNHFIISGETYFHARESLRTFVTLSDGSVADVVITGFGDAHEVSPAQKARNRRGSTLGGFPFAQNAPLNP